MIKLICIDMDGTLLNNHHEVSTENIKAIKRATSKGVKVAITTGRIFCSAKYYSNFIGIDTPVIASNGAFIREQNSEEIIYSNPIPSYFLSKIYEIINKYNLKILFNTSNTVISFYDLPETHVYKIMNKELNTNDKVNFFIAKDITDIVNTFKENILKGIVIEPDNIDNLIAAKKELINILGAELHIVSSSVNNFEIMLNSSTKGIAVEILAKKYNFTSDEVMCIGDSENDLSMIKYAGIGVAMGNASDEIKSHANYITDTNENFGVAKAINKYI